MKALFSTRGIIRMQLIVLALCLCALQAPGQQEQDGQEGAVPVNFEEDPLGNDLPADGAEMGDGEGDANDELKVLFDPTPVIVGMTLDANQPRTASCTASLENSTDFAGIEFVVLNWDMTQPSNLVTITNPSPAQMTAAETTLTIRSAVGAFGAAKIVARKDGAALGELPVLILKAEFIDSIPDYSLDANTDSDNFFLREETEAGDADHEDLDVYYRIMLPDVPGDDVDVCVNDVKIKVYKGNTSTVAATLQGETDTAGKCKAGDNLHVTWTPTLATAEADPGFYRLQLQVFAGGGTTPTCETPIEDADSTTAGWQCPQKGLAVHDLMWKHRIKLHVHEDEIGPPSSIDEFMVESGNHVREWTGGDDPTIHPVGTIPTSENSFWDLFDDNKVTGGDLSDYTAEQIAVLTTDSNKKTVYHCTNTEDADNFVFLQFFMFENFSRRPFGIAGLPFNPNVQHEGDMEHCQIAVRLKDTADAANKAKWILPFGATVSQHYYAQTLRWDPNNGSAAANAHTQNHVEHSNNRLAVYVALGAHATYFVGDADIEVPDINSHLGTQQQYDPNPEGAYDVAGPAEEISYTLTHVDNVILGSFNGRWGYLKKGAPGSLSNGPAGPPHRAAKKSDGTLVNLRSSPKALHNLARKTSQMAEMLIP